EESARLEMLAHDAAELKRYPIPVGELKVGNSVPHLCGELSRGGEPHPELLRETHETRLAAKRDLFRRVVGAEEAAFIVLVERNQRGQPPCHAGMAGERTVLALGEGETPLQLDERRGERAGAKGVQHQRRRERIHGRESYYGRLTVS